MSHFFHYLETFYVLCAALPSLWTFEIRGPSRKYRKYFGLMKPGELFRYSDGLCARRPEFASRQGRRIFLYSTVSRPVLGPTQPLIQWVSGGSFPRAERPGCEADHSPPPIAEVNKNGAIPPLPHTSSWRGS
jgi:hypothetical protein